MSTSPMWPALLHLHLWFVCTPHNEEPVKCNMPKKFLGGKKCHPQKREGFYWAWCIGGGGCWEGDNWKCWVGINWAQFPRCIYLSFVSLFSFTWCHIFYLEFSDVSVLGNTSGSIDTDVGKLPRIGVLHGPQFLTLDDQRKDVLGPMLDLAYLHSCPFIDGRLLCPEQLSIVSLPIESGANVDSTGPMDPQ